MTDASVGAGVARPLGGLLLRDARVLRREFVPFLLRVVLNPLLFVFVFTYVFPRAGLGFTGTRANFATLLVPGLVAVAIMFQGVTGVAMSLAIELSGTRELEDRLMAPIPVGLVALEKVLFSTAQGILAAVIVFPLVYLVPATEVAVRVASWPLLLAVVVLAGFTAGALGLVIGTFMRPRRINLVMSVIVVPVTFLGCVYYPWQQLAPIGWLQAAVLLNPLVYISEGLRAALTPQVPHMPVAAALAANALAAGLLGWLGVRSFVRRVTD